MWYRTAGTLRDLIAEMRSTAGALVSADSARAFTEARYQSVLASAIAGDNAAATDLPGAAKAMLQATRDTATSRLDLARAEARVLSDLQLTAGVSDLEGARHDVLAGLLGDQVSLLQEVRDYLNAGGQLEANQLAAFQASLGSLGSAIAAVESISYADIRARLDVVMSATDTMPGWMKDALGQAASGITADVDFIVRAEGLTPDLRWIALTGASEHLKTVEYLADNRLGRDMTRLALATSSGLARTVTASIASGIDRNAMRIALTGTSELMRVVNVLMASGIDSDTLRLALGRVRDTSNRVRVSVTAEGITDLDHRLLRQLERGNRQLTQTIIGSVDIGRLSRAQRGLLDSITGATAGRLTLGGSFQFDPSRSFQRWYEDTSRIQVTSPIATLRDTLDALRRQLVSDAADRARDARIAGLQSDLARVTTERARVAGEAAGIIGQIRALEAETGVDIRNGARDAALNVTDDGYIQYRATGVEYGRGADIGAFRAAFWGPGGLEDQLKALIGRPTALMGRIEALRGQITGLGGIPAYATGGLHPGGLRLVGERGPELEVTGPSRIHSAAETARMLGGGNAELLAEVRALRRQVRDLAAQQRDQSGRLIVEATKNRQANERRNFEDYDQVVTP
ncbi:hypothetical protein EKE94_03165 [Mesobaculum littorinae]|uniref:Uncharacterized protein n=1 Tax=Mesobaculum littorinae TaxID=2486419 RepID=A0A438AMC6_9RHOB|nr:hypothetical protein [Mesobaculum littorinae]RVV99696.1 hypothetical protein EKE94_03165 [Mesobaculum littorinae]